jgi:DNA polymerase
MFIGEAPGFHEDQQGLPFVGAAGKLLDELLVSILGKTRQDIYIANVLKCRPPNNRDPFPNEIETCRPWLEKQIELIKPQIICTLGNFSTRVLMGKTVYISKVHGQAFDLRNYLLFPTYHPAAALYTAATKNSLVEDFTTLADLLLKDAKPKPYHENKQLELF